MKVSGDKVTHHFHQKGTFGLAGEVRMWLTCLRNRAWGLQPLEAHMSSKLRLGATVGGVSLGATAPRGSHVFGTALRGHGP